MLAVEMFGCCCQDGDTPLMHALANRKVEVAQALLTIPSVDVNVQDRVRVCVRACACVCVCVCVCVCKEGNLYGLSQALM